MRNEAETRAELIDSALAEEPKGGGQIVPPLAQPRVPVENRMIRNAKSVTDCHQLVTKCHQLESAEPNRYKM